LDGVDEPLVVPHTGLEELLEIAYRHTRVQGQGLGSLPFEVCEQSACIVTEMLNVVQ